MRREQKKLRVSEIPNIRILERVLFVASIGSLSVMAWFLAKSFGVDFVEKYITAPDDPHIAEEILAMPAALIMTGVGSQFFFMLKAFMEMYNSRGGRIEPTITISRGCEGGNMQIPLLRDNPRVPQLAVKPRSRSCMQALSILLKTLFNIPKYVGISALVPVTRCVSLLTNFPEKNSTEPRVICWLIFIVCVLILVFELRKDFREMFPSSRSRHAVRLVDDEAGADEQEVGGCANICETLRSCFR